MSNYGNVLMSLGRPREAARMLRRMVELDRRQRVLSADHPDTNFSRYSLAQVAALKGNRAEALDWLRQAVDHGLAIADEMAADAAFESLRGVPEFQAIVANARSNASKK